ncbi:MAG: FAD-dependent oxidoreductase [Pseudomonadota bacterium]
MSPHFSRRELLNFVAAAGGTHAVYQTSRALGLLADSTPPASLNLSPVGSAARTAVVLGAGIAGLTVAYELERAGYGVTIIEASHRVGGRNMTVRSGDVIDELGQRQVCQFDDEPNLYFNAGPARIPGHHQRTLKYCRDLNVPLIVKANFARNAYHQDDASFAGRPVRLGHYVADARGFLSELLHKAVDKNQFDQALSADDRERLLEFVTAFGDLDDSGNYAGSRRAGYARGYQSPEEYRSPLPFDDMLGGDFWKWVYTASENPDWGDPLMEVPGGMDGIVQAFVRELSSPITLNAPVQSIDVTADGVDVVFCQQGVLHQVSADYCFNSIPAHFLPGIPSNLPREYKNALAALKPNKLMKIGLQMKRRFWEEEGIYGGTTLTSQPIGELWYPSHDIHAQKGVVIGAYTHGDGCATWSTMTPSERLRAAAECGERIHSGYAELVESGVSVPWERMNHMMGCSVHWTEALRQQHFDVLRRPVAGRHYLVGDQMSYHPTWQEGAFASAEYALLDLDKRVRSDSAVGRLA